MLSPQDDPLSALLERYLPANQRPQRDLSGNHQGQTLDELIVRPLILSSRPWIETDGTSHDAVCEELESSSSILSRYNHSFFTSKHFPYPTGERQKLVI